VAFLDYVSVAEAAKDLGISPRRVRSLVEGGKLAGRQVGSHWIIEREAVESWKRQRHPNGRPLSRSSVWQILAALSGEDDALKSLAAPVRSRAKQRARELAEAVRSDPAWFGVLASRADSRAFYAHPGILRRILDEPGVVRSGVSALSAHNAGLAEGGEAECYVRAEVVPDLCVKYALRPDVDRHRANIIMHVINEVPQAAEWLFERPVAPAPVVAADLAERPQARDRDAARRLMASS
jgi:excisionase family DNA binding protein